MAGVSGWTWGVAAGIGMTWVREDQRGTGVGRRLLDAFEDEARRRGCGHVYVTSFTFQAPAFYERAGYRELFRWDDVPARHRGRPPAQGPLTSRRACDATALRSAAGSPRAAADERRVDDEVLRRRGVAADAREEPLRDEPADLGHVLADDGERRVEEVGQREVVEADERDLVVHAALAQRPDGPGREDVPAGEDRGRRVVEVEEPVHDLARLVGGGDTVDDQPRVGAQAAVGVGGGEALASQLGRRERRQVEEGGDASVAPVEQVLGGHPAPEEVVDDDRVDVDPARRTVDEDRRGPVRSSATR